MAVSFTAKAWEEVASAESSRGRRSERKSESEALKTPANPPLPGLQLVRVPLVLLCDEQMHFLVERLSHGFQRKAACQRSKALELIPETQPALVASCPPHFLRNNRLATLAP